MDIPWLLGKFNGIFILVAEELHAHHSKDKNDDEKYKAQVSQRTHRSADDANQ